MRRLPDVQLVRCRVCEFAYTGGYATSPAPVTDVKDRDGLLGIDREIQPVMRQLGHRSERHGLLDRQRLRPWAGVWYMPCNSVLARFLPTIGASHDERNGRTSKDALRARTRYKVAAHDAAGTRCRSHVVRHR